MMTSRERQDIEDVDGGVGRFERHGNKYNHAMSFK